MDNPKLIQVPFAEQSTARNDIPVARTVDLSAENATYQEGFPSVAMTPVASGGIPPDGKDINGVLNDLSANVSFLNKGGIFKFDASFASDVGGYPKGAVVADANGVVVFAGEAINVSQSDITTVRVGLEGSDIGTNFTAYIDNLLIGSQAVTVVNGLFTGTFTTGNAKTATVVNGLIVGVV